MFILIRLMNRLRANLIALKYKPSASELIDHYILECTKDNIEQSKNRFFVQGDPGRNFGDRIYRRLTAKKLLLLQSRM